MCSLSSGGDAQGLQGNGPEPPSPHPGHAGPGPLALTEATSLFLGLVQSPQGASILLSPEIPPPGSRRPCSLTWPCPCPRWASLLVPTWVREQRGQSGSTRKAGPGSQPRLSPARTPGRGRGIPREESQDLRGHRQAARCTAVREAWRVLGQRRGRVCGAAQQCGPRTGHRTYTHPRAQDTSPGLVPPFPSQLCPWPGLWVPRSLPAPLSRACPPAPEAPAGPITWSSWRDSLAEAGLGRRAPESCSTCGAFLPPPPPPPLCTGTGLAGNARLGQHQAPAAGGGGVGGGSRPQMVQKLRSGQGGSWP